MATGNVSDRVRELAEYRGIDEAEVIQRAVESGVETLYRNMVVSQYLDGVITREEAADELGEEVVAKVAAAREAVEDDVTWGLTA